MVATGLLSVEEYPVLFAPFDKEGAANSRRRAVGQLYLGHRGDWAILVGFSLLAEWHGLAALPLQ
jgi:hypothetical protein